MRLDFNVLWVEDQQNLVESTRDRIEMDIKREGFRLKVQFVSSIAEATQYLSDDIYGDHIDLILMDFDLGAGGRGDDGLVEVRNLFKFKDIIFYSSRANDLPGLVAEKKIQGVFCSERNSLHETVQGVFDTLMKKVLDIDHSRGIIMGATSDIDHYVNDCLAASFNGGTEETRVDALNVIARHVKEKDKDFKTNIQGLGSIKNVTELHEFHSIYTSNDRLRLLKNILNGSAKYKLLIPVIEQYLKETVPKRNLLAHVRVKVEGFSRKLYDKHGVELTNEQMKMLRQALLEFQLEFEKLHEELNLPVE